MFEELLASFKKQENKRDPDKTDFCYYPFFQVLLAADGRYMPCSHHANFINENGENITEQIDDITSKINFLHNIKKSI